MYEALNQRSYTGFLPWVLFLAVGEPKIIVITMAGRTGSGRTQQEMQNFQMPICLLYTILSSM